MKKLYLEPEHIYHNSKKSKDEMAKRTRKNKIKTISKSHFVKRLPCIFAPEYFSLIENTVETQLFFTNIFNHIKIKEFFIDLKPVKKLTIETVLYLVTIMANTKNCLIHGNAPDDPDMKKIFLDSGFYNYVNSTYRHNETGAFVSIKSGTLVQSEIVGEIIDFARKKLQLNNKKMTRDIYTTIMELMINVKEHASRNKKLQEWWLVAYYNENKNSVSFSMLDRGRGIPTTIKRKFRDLFNLSDTQLLISTLLGEERSETALPYRGKGLPKIYEYVIDNKVKNLYIISNKGFFSSENISNCDDLEVPFVGTLVSWDFIPEVHDENN